MKADKVQEWNQRAWAMEAWEERLTVPFHVLVGEAVDVARFAQRHWEPVVGSSGHEITPGLKGVVANGSFGAGTISELLELVDVLQHAQTTYRLLVSGAKAAVPLERVQFVLSELRATLEWCFDDDQLTEEDAQLENLATVHEGAVSHDALAAALFDYAEMSERCRDKLVGLGGFDGSVIEEARALAAQLRAQSAGPARTPPKPAEREALELRNRLATLLGERVTRVRAAARFAFRRHPELVRQASSTYARRRRAQHRKKRAEAGDGGVPVGASEGNPAVPVTRGEGAGG
jgi:hypothetical protein